MSQTTHRFDPATSVLAQRAAEMTSSMEALSDWAELDLDNPLESGFGDYQLLEKLGQGGMGVVFRARQASLAREVAIKFMLVRGEGPTSSSRFRDEAQNAARLHHPGIVPVFEFGTAGALHYFTMPLMAGSTLAEVLASRRLSVRECVSLLAEVCGAVAYAHRLGLLHLDLKPANILMDESERPRVADFGLARMVNENGFAEAFDMSGTPSYMPPEQAQGSGAVLTRATDVYALGAILYQMLTGHSPHGEGTPERVIATAKAGGILPVSSRNSRVPADLAAICDRCLQFDPQMRYQDAGGVERDLLRFLDGLPVSARPLGAVAQAGRLAMRHRALSGTIALLLFSLVTGTVAIALQWQRAEKQRVLAEARAHQMIELAKRLASTHPSAGLKRDSVCFGDMKRVEGLRFEGKMDCVSLKLAEGDD